MTFTALRMPILAALLSGCAATTTIDEFRPSTAPIEIGAGEKIVVLGRRDAGHYETDRDFVDCVGTPRSRKEILRKTEEVFNLVFVRANQLLGENASDDRRPLQSFMGAQPLA